MVCAFRSAGGAYRDRHGRGQRNAMDAAARSGVITSPTNGLTRTAKSCGPGIPVLMPCATRKRCRNRAATSARVTGAREPVPGESSY